MEARPNFPLLLGLILLSALAVGFAWMGWHGHVPSPDAAYLAIKSVEGGDAYGHIAKEFSDNTPLEIGRFVGIFVEPVAFLVLFISLSRQNLLRLWASFKRGHVIVVGDSAFADKLSESHKAAVVHLRGIEDDVHQKGSLIRLPFGGFDPTDLYAAGARKADRIVVACADDAQSIDLATAAHRLFPGAQVSVRVNDFWLAEQIHNTAGAERLYAFSESCLAARYVLRRHPPFLLAQDSGQSRIHALLFGDHDNAEALMAEMILSAKTLTFGKIIFTFVCTQPDLFKTRLLHRYPEIESEAELYIHAALRLDGREVAFPDIPTLEQPAPLTCVYSVETEGARSLAAALAFVRQARDLADFKAPVFVLRGAQGIDRPPAGAPLPALRIVPFGSMDDLTRANGMHAKAMELAEHRFHEAYLGLGSVTGEAATSWDKLKEEYRASNRRAVAHIYAKLFDAGVNVRAWMADHDLWATLPILPDGQRLFHDDDARERLAMLEHERWIADRRLSGWRFGEHRDNLRKIHPDIRPYAELSQGVQDYDRALVDVVDRILTSLRGAGK